MAKRDGSRRRGLSQDERVLWTAVTRSIAPMPAGALPDIDIEIGAETPQPARPAKRVEPAVPVKPDTTPALAPLTPLGRRQRRSVARGKEAIDARLDLRGLTQAQAHAALLRFLRDASTRGARLVLVITGKGSRDGERGVLKRQVPQWLALPEFRSFAIGFEDAGLRHGG